MVNNKENTRGGEHKARQRKRFSIFAIVKNNEKQWIARI
jgi:hypothetical protein